MAQRSQPIVGASPRGARRRRTSMAVAIKVLGLALGLVHCDALGRLKASLHAPPEAALGPTDPPALGFAGLDVTVEPPTGMTVLVDGVAVGHASPLHARDLRPGAHTLNVRAMGYHDLILPIALAPSQVLRVPVSLRPRPPKPFDAPSADSPAGPSRSPRPETAVGASGAAPAPAARTAAHSVPLPPGMTPVELHLVAQPPAPIVADGEANDGRSLRLRRGRGSLAIGSLQMAYTVGAGRTVDFLVPQDGCLWYREGVQLKPGSLVRLSRGLLRLRRVAPSGTEQKVVMRRLG